VEAPASSLYAALRARVDLFDTAALLAAGDKVDAAHRDEAIGELGPVLEMAKHGMELVCGGSLADGIAGIGDCRLFENLARLAGGDPCTAIDAAAKTFAALEMPGAPPPDGATRAEAARAFREIARRVRNGSVAW